MCIKYTISIICYDIIITYCYDIIITSLHVPPHVHVGGRT